MIDRAAFTPDGSNPPYPVVLSPTCTVPTKEMAEFLAGLLNTNGYVLEIGTGSGYQTAILASKCKGVFSVECNPVDGVAEKLPDNVVLFVGDGVEYDTGAQFDGILVTFATPAISSIWVDQLKEGGRLVAPLVLGSACPIAIFEKEDGILQWIDVAGYAPFTRLVINA